MLRPVQSFSITPGFDEFSFSYGLRRAVAKFLLLWIAIIALPVIPGMIFDPQFWSPSLGSIPLSVLGVPVNLQDCSEYFLAKTAES